MNTTLPLQHAGATCPLRTDSHCKLRVSALICGIAQVVVSCGICCGEAVLGQVILSVL